MTSAENNLYRLYRDISTFSQAEYVSDLQSGFACIKYGVFEWPNMSFAESPGGRYDFQLLADKIRSGLYPRLFIFNENILADNPFKGQLVNNRFVAAGRWTSMTLDVDAYSPWIDEQSDIEEIKSADLAGKWTEALSSGLFSGKKLDERLFAAGLEKGIFRLFGKLADSKIIATTLVYNSSDGPGIYMVSTRPDYRKRGFGFEIMNFVLQKLRHEGCRKVVLQSTAEGLSLYTKIGFTPGAVLSLYYCMLK